MSPELRSADDLLQAAREQAEPDASEGARVLRGVQARLDLPASSPPSGPWPLQLHSTRDIGWGASAQRAGVAASLLTRLGRTLRARRAWLQAVAATAIFAAGFILGRVTLEHAPPLATAPVVAQAASVPVPPPAQPLAELPVPAPASVSDPAPVRARVSTQKPSHPSERTAAGAVDTNSLQEALRYLRRAQRALREREPQRALAVLDDLDRRVSAEVLVEERQMTRVLASCQSGELDDARRVARDLLARHRDSVYLTRLQNTCVPDVAADALERLLPRP
jgi:hypothetical protein